MDVATDLANEKPVILKIASHPDDGEDGEGAEGDGAAVTPE